MMIKYFCDRCGKDLSRDRRIGYVAVNSKDKAEGELQEDNEFETWHFCGSCTEEIKRFVRKAPKSDQNEEKVLKNEEKCTENDEKRTESEEKRSVSSESEEKSQGSETESHEVKKEVKKEGKAGREGKFDVGKIMALRKAGWPVKEIAGEMHMTAQQVSNQIYLHNKKMQAALDEKNV